MTLRQRPQSVPVLALVLSEPSHRKMLLSTVWSFQYPVEKLVIVDNTGVLDVGVSAAGGQQGRPRQCGGQVASFLGS